jgi:hypothetical protein
MKTCSCNNNTLWLNNKTVRYNRFLLNSTEPEQVGIKQELVNYKTLAQTAERIAPGQAQATNYK